jgi:dTDP-4-dehydrorhamnose reductase
VDVRALTVWALLGSHDWDSLLTNWRGSYEAGAFDVSGGRPEETPLADLVRDLAGGGLAAAGRPGWWEDAGRLLYPACGPRELCADAVSNGRGKSQHFKALQPTPRLSVG